MSREEREAKKFSVAFKAQKRELEAEKSELFIEIRKLFYSFPGRDCGESKESQCMNQILKKSGV